MSRLAINIDKWLEGPDAVNAVVAHVRQVADSEGRPVMGRPRHDIVVPIGPSGAIGYLDDIDPGRYLVEVPLPSGDILSEEVARPTAWILQPRPRPLILRLRQIPGAMFECERERWGGFQNQSPAWGADV